MRISSWCARLNISGPMSVHFEYPPFEKGAAGDPDGKTCGVLAAMKKDLELLKGYMAKYKVA